LAPKIGTQVNWYAGQGINDPSFSSANLPTTKGKAMDDLFAAVQAADVALVSAFCTKPGAGVSDPGSRSDVVQYALAIRKKASASETLSDDQMQSASMVLLAHASLSDINKVGGVSLHDLDLVYRILALRDQSFLTGWANSSFAEIGIGTKRVAHRLVREGLVEKPRTAEYVMSFIGCPSAFDLTSERVQWRGHASVLDVLRRNPELLAEDFWLIFQFEGGGEDSLAAFDKYCTPMNTWMHAVTTLASEGMLDRDRLLAESLDSLMRGFSQFRAQWFGALHQALQPTLAERTACTSRYLALLASPLGPTVSMSLKALTMIHKTSPLDLVELLAAVQPALLTPAKGPAVLAVSLLVSALRTTDDQELKLQGSLALVEALGHSAVEVQAAALGHISKTFPKPPEDIVDRVRALQSGCHVSVRKEIDLWLRQESATLSVPRPKAAAPATTETSTETVLNTAVSSGVTTGQPRACWLDESRRLSPLMPNALDIDDLFELVSATMERPEDVDLLEQLIALIVRTDRSVVRADPRAATIAKRAEKLHRTSNRATQAWISRLIAAWLLKTHHGHEYHQANKHLDAFKKGGAIEISLDLLLATRIEVLARAIQSTSPIDLLAEPTHRGGVIDPVVFARRWNELTEPPHPIELAIALLRLAPDTNRLEEASTTLRNFVDGVEVPPEVLGWIDGWTTRCQADEQPMVWSGEPLIDTTYTHYPLKVQNLPSFVAPGGITITTEANTYWSALFGEFGHDLVGVRWLSTVLPGLPATWARIGAMAIGATYGTKEVAHGDPGFLDRWFDPSTTFGSCAHFLLALAINDGRMVVHSVAVDLCVATIADARFDPVEFGTQIGNLASTGVVTPARWGRSLRDVAATSSLHRAQILRSLEVAVAEARPRKPQDLLALLELLETLLLESSELLRLPTIPNVLAEITGSSKTAKVAARLLTLCEPSVA
jgi:Family of unknown function (DUF6493)